MRPTILRNLLTALIVGGLVFPTLAAAQDEPALSKGQFVIWPSGALAFPTGRFSKTDLQASPPKLGHSSGFSGGIAAGYVVGETVIIGLQGNMSRFDIDFGTDAENIFEADGNTTTLSAEAWVRYFLGGGFARWQPFIHLGMGLSRPKGKVDYGIAAPFDINDTLRVQGESLESTVATSLVMALGAGALIPVSKRISFSLEGMARTVSSKGSDRTDVLTTIDGEVFTFTRGTDSGEVVSLKAKNDTNWWEIRGGIVFFLR
jgi:hypothetical protein